MVKIIAHRINKIKDYKNLNDFYGIETDIRDHNQKIILSHDPFQNGEDFFKFIKYVDKTVFLNIKSFGLLKKILNNIKKKKYIYLIYLFLNFIFYINIIYLIKYY